ncbi:MAG TPA: aldose 1-epimerase [Cytophagaceae bacterium]|jgi:aldose 1-epimerase
MYSIVSEPFGKYTRIKLINTKTQEYAAIIPDFGANVNALVLNKNEKSYQVIEGDTDPVEMVDLVEKWYRGSKLVPYPNRVANGKYSFEGEDYKLPLNHGIHSIHGLVYKKKFSVVAQKATEEDAIVELEYNYNRDDKGYPFKFQLNIQYVFNESGLTLVTQIKNTDDRNIPVADAWHLYFQVTSKIDECLFKIPTGEVLEVDDTLIPTGKKLVRDKYVHFAKIEDDTFDTCFILPGKKSTVAVEIFDIVEDIRVSVWQETGPKKYNYIQIFSSPSRKSLAIEAMSCEPNAFNTGEGLVILKPGDNFEASCGVRLS